MAFLCSNPVALSFKSEFAELFLDYYSFYSLVVKNPGPECPALASPHLPFSLFESMLEAQKIRGKGRFDIFQQLQSDKTLIKIHIPSKGYERLTIVTGFRTQNNTPFFLIDYPGDFEQALDDEEIWRMDFEFTGKDNIQYAFRTSGGEISGDEIWVRFPDLIERRQRRENFRLDAPMGAKLHLKGAPTEHEMSVINISLGGTSGVVIDSIRKKRGTGRRDPIFKTGETLRHLQLRFPSKERELTVNIKKSVVRRVEEIPRMNRYRYGLQFTEMEKKEGITLTKLIYKFQREYLRNRLPINV
jgi:c-di-GMP-binding flagellar brake protein YcgR